MESRNRTLSDVLGRRELVMVSNRLPVDRVTAPDGSVSWRTSPGGLVTAVEPIVKELGCLWVGWAGIADAEIEPFSLESMQLAPVTLSADEIEEYYEGFSNGTLWPLYHDVIAQPEYHREWWETYRAVNRRFAERVAESAGEGAIVWVHDYQLQLVPEMIREMRPDLTIAFFLHIPFPPGSLFAQLPWRKPIVRGMLGADVVGFQRVQDAVNFRMAAERYLGAPALGNALRAADGRQVLAQEFPISIDAAAFEELGRLPRVRQRAREIRDELGDPETVMLGVDRLDYTKGIRHRLKAFEEMLADGDVSARDAVLVQVASPSRERVGAYQQLRDDVEVTVGRINGSYGAIGATPVVYLHQGYGREEMAALYLAADVLLVTPLRDGMNLVAKEYIAVRSDERGVLVLSEFAGAADELRDALLVNPHDIEGLKSTILRAVHMPAAEQERRMRALRSVITHYDVARWAEQFLGAVGTAAELRDAATEGGEAAPTGEISVQDAFVPRSLAARIRRLASAPALTVVTDFDGTVAPIVARPQDARILPRARQALEVLSRAPGVSVVVLSGRSLAGLAATGLDAPDWTISGSHGAELASPGGAESGGPAPLSDDDAHRIASLERLLHRVLGDEPGVRFEQKPFGIAVHTREVRDEAHAEELLEAAVELAASAGFKHRVGKRVREFSVRDTDKGSALAAIRAGLPEAPALFLGDDVTDEDVFATLSPDDVGIKVGEGDTQARERVEGPAAAAAVLAMLAELRTGVVIGSGPADSDG
ncbi:bifunctional alpha,alpha-trehalose-phosphate synthase (UDP-forming)/trehalose-phosphatase [Leucobacter ruminantium]|uniref:Bifunctional alpha,alpha-trehalose-phosphate synthase (UDP-forming)/trehalose-phosphatase n=1 Tax=Leucobacter ruminantium TaxID=1289170 RepID=A0A939LVL4_9MICO|nr:bifunctional alpha,alpha-trehalose-phosphate synthase (UDP-forming)/trehalose-phosphatase [Leucobacter ruminantium]MBO1804931.1 bifunctional alpha,alpha-trehalose-phosphate synthase (UDP-forming)/trehalose-phosphatase [Leucobacter ruminantium]